MNPFARHKIEHLSPTSLNTWIDQPAMWAAKYLLGFKDENAAMWRGLAVEGGLDAFLVSRDPNARCPDLCLGRALDRFDLTSGGLCDDATLRERNRVKPMLANAMRAAMELPPPVLRQNPIEYWFDGIEVPIKGVTDYEWDDWGMDLKTANRMPSAIPARHARQVSVYQAARKKPFKLLYVTEGKSKMDALTGEESALHLKRLEWYAHSIRRVLSVFTDGMDVARLYPPDLDHFYWKSDEARNFANQTWSL